MDRNGIPVFSRAPEAKRRVEGGERKSLVLACGGGVDKYIRPGVEITPQRYKVRKGLFFSASLQRIEFGKTERVEKKPCHRGCKSKTGLQGLLLPISASCCGGGEE